MRATLRKAELGFLGVVVCTRVQTPRRWGAATFFFRPLPDFKPGVSSFFLGLTRPLRISWLAVGMDAQGSSGAERGPSGAAARLVRRRDRTNVDSGSVAAFPVGSTAPNL